MNIAITMVSASLLASAVVLAKYLTSSFMSDGQSIVGQTTVKILKIGTPEIP